MSRPGAWPGGRLAVAGGALAMLVIAGLAGRVSVARAGTEQFSTFDVEHQEEDDESLLDHTLTRPPREWRYEWEHAESAIRTSQGCLTSGQWFINTDLKMRTALGRSAQFGLNIEQNESDQLSYDYVDFSFHFPTTLGTFGAMFRPLYDKSRQDFGVTWESGSDSSGLQIQAMFVFEDLFNNLWEFRQSRVGNASEPYLRHPYEPNLRLVHRSDDGFVRRFEVRGTWLTPSVKKIEPYVGAMTYTHQLWGASTSGSLELHAAGFDWEARGTNIQAADSQQPDDFSTGDGRNFRRQWTAEGAASRRLWGRVVVEGRYLYQDRRQSARPPVGPSYFDAIDRLMMFETRFPIHGSVSARLGGLYDRITVVYHGAPYLFTYGTRNESRAFVGLMARFGRVSVHAIEGIELDPEPYDVWFFHDKGFLHLQATF